MRILSTVFLCTLALFCFAQQTTSNYIKFGKITVADLQQKNYTIDSSADAVVLSDVGEAAIEGNSKGWFSISFTRHRVVHILNKNGYNEANVEVHLYADGNAEENLENVKAVTYNLENGKIIETKLEKSEIYKEKVKKNLVVKKFTMPNVKEGCIIEYEYHVTSDFLQNLDTWIFQGTSPVLWSEYNLTLPSFFSYAFLSHGYHPFYIHEHTERQANFTVRDAQTAAATETYNISSRVSDYRWVMKDVPEIKEESFTSAIKNHLSSIEFQLASQNYPLTPHDYRSSWQGLTKNLLEAEYFGSNLKNANNWLSDEIKPLTAGKVSEIEKARKIFTYVRDNFTCTDQYAFGLEQSLKNVLKTKKGSVAEINLLLTAMLRYAGLNADPVILSTTDHGYALAMYPMITYFNYVVAQFTSEGKSYYLDASRTRLGFDKMLPECYNGHARIVDEAATAVFFSADSLKEKKLTSLFISSDEKGNWTGVMHQTPGYFESYNIRNKVKEKGKDEFFKDIQKVYGTDLKISTPQIDSLNNYEEPITLNYNVELNTPSQDILYISPMFGEGYKKNPFKSAERYYPVEMPYTMDEIYLLTIEVPAGYVVDELPKQMLAKFDEQGATYFEYRITLSENMISLRSRIKIAKAMFIPDEYDTLREFFNLIVKKQNEQIVFKKKK